MKPNKLQIPTLAYVRSKRDDMLAIAKRYDVEVISIVGSVARGEATEDSDIDLLLSMPNNHSVFTLVGLWLDLEALLQCDVNLIPDSADNTRFMQSVRKDAVPL